MKLHLDKKSFEQLCKVASDWKGIPEEAVARDDLVKKYELEPVSLNVLNVERTFLDKIMSVKRHAFCGTLSEL